MPAEQSPSDASTAASAASAASLVSSDNTTPSSASSANPTTVATDIVSSRASLSDWYPDNRWKLNKYLGSRKKAQSASALPSDVASLVTNFCDGIRIYKGEDGKDVTVVTVDMTQQTAGNKTFTVKDADGADDYKMNFNWAPAQDGETSFNFGGAGAPTTNPTQNMSMPDLKQFTRLKQPQKPPKPDWLKSVDVNTLKKAPPKDKATWGYSTYMLNKYAVMATDPALVEYIERLARPISEAAKTTGEDISVENTVRAGATAAENKTEIPEVMASNLLEEIKVLTHVGKERREAFEIALTLKLQEEFDNPAPMSTSANGLTLPDYCKHLKSAEHLYVADGATRLGRWAALYGCRKELETHNGSEAMGGTVLSWDQLTKMASTMVDWVHAYDVDEHAVLELALEHCRESKALPSHCPKSLIDDATARKLAKPATDTFATSSSTRSTARSKSRKLTSKTGPQPRTIEAHKLTRSVGTSSGASENGREGADMWSEVAGTLTPKQKATVRTFFDSFGQNNPYSDPSDTRFGGGQETKLAWHACTNWAQ